MSGSKSSSEEMWRWKLVHCLNAKLWSCYLKAVRFKSCREINQCTVSLLTDN